VGLEPCFHKFGGDEWEQLYMHVVAELRLKN